MNNDNFEMTEGNEADKEGVLKSMSELSQRITEAEEGSLQMAEVISVLKNQVEEISGIAGDIVNLREAVAELSAGLTEVAGKTAALEGFTSGIPVFSVKTETAPDKFASIKKIFSGKYSHTT